MWTIDCKLGILRIFGLFILGARPDIQFDISGLYLRPDILYYIGIFGQISGIRPVFWLVIQNPSGYFASNPVCGRILSFSSVFCRMPLCADLIRSSDIRWSGIRSILFLARTYCKQKTKGVIKCPIFHVLWYFVKLLSVNMEKRGQ